MSDLKNPMRFSIRHRRIDMKGKLWHPDFDDKRVIEIEVCPSEGQVYVHWESVPSDTETAQDGDSR